MDDNNGEIEIKTEAEVVGQSKKNKLSEANALIEASQELVAKVDSEISECKIGISSAAEDFDEAKRTFNNVTFKNSEVLLEKVGFEYTTFEEAEAFELAVDGNEDESFSVKNLSSGRFTGLILAIVVALLTVVAWIYLAMTKLGIDPSSITLDNASEQVNPILTWIGGDMISANGNMTVGALILGFSALIMAWLVYAIRINLKGSKNLRIAKKTYEKSKDYCMTQEECQKEMKKVDVHLREATEEIQNLDMILNEQASVLRRVIHVEGVYDGEKEYHPSSKKVMRETEKIMRASEHLVSTAITQEQKLNFKSVQALNAAKDIYSEYLGRIYD
ncbi:MAG: ORF 73 extensive acidic domains, potential leucine zipper immediate early protein homolog [uncultured Sulfurovum sp.]|uniref:ORF 73 extensive acidic domains, potential leucine zipper immediate early protein homolog n=1 Tax=uncultured Sulfurovum sp. TaxID=269237 RepID=A0A6S6U3W4_9BACT|nr:MAG: ORF 73 extensive acidic domains, potential leucine zipper immediate early protein homolog [uncultured Sulfurovum sp.]